MKNEAIQNINKIGRISNIVLKISKVIMIIGAIIMLVVTGLSFTISSDDININFEGNGSIELNSDRLPLEDMFLEIDAEEYIKTDVIESNENSAIYSMSAKVDKVQIEELFNEFRKESILISIAMIYIVVVIVFGEKIAKALSKCESPFEETVIKALKKFSYIFIPMAFIDLSEGFDLISINGILTVLIVFALVKVFEYGGKLQQESDETL